MFSELKQSLRSLSKSPGLVAVIVLTLALGIGVNATVFSWVRSVLLNPLHGVPAAERLVTLETMTPAGGYIDSSYPDFRDYRDHAQSLEGVLAFAERPLSFGSDERPERVWAQFVSGNFFDVLGVKPLAGRFFLKEEQEDVANKHAVAVISAQFWRSHFNSDPSIVGKTIRLNRQELTVVGVAPDAFRGTIVGLAFDVWAPLMMEPTLRRTGNGFEERKSRGWHLMARLKPDVSLHGARTEIQTLAKQLAQTYPDSNAGIGATLLPIYQAPYGVQSRLGSLLQILLGAGAVVLLIVCANVANLLLVRATVRQKEIGIRLALGASHRRVIAQTMVEGLLLAGSGGAVGVLLAARMTDFLRVFIPVTHMPIALDFPLDYTVMAFTLSIAVLAGLVFSLAPALQAVRADQQTAWKQDSRGVTGSNRLRGMLVISEVALSMLALVGAGLFLNSFHHAKRIDPGFEPSGVMIAALNLSERGYTREQGMRFTRRLRERAETLPGVRDVAFSEDVPLGFDGGSWEDLDIEGYVPKRGDNMKIYRNPVSPGYFDLMRIPLVAGRDFTDRDDVRSQLVAIVNETFAQRFFPAQSAVGRQIKLKGWGRELTVVGVAKDIKYASINESPQPYFYLPLEQAFFPAMGLALHVRTDGPPLSVLPDLRHELRSLDPGVTLFEVMDLRDYIGAAWFAQKIAATLLSVLGTLALMLAAVGLFSVMAYTVSQRTHEIGIRMAIGAQTTDVLRMIVAQALRLTMTGIAVGLALSITLAPLIANQLLGVSAVDPLTFSAVAALLIVVAMAACWLPARRASRIDPLAALRTE